MKPIMSEKVSRINDKFLLLQVYHGTNKSINPLSANLIKLSNTQTECALSVLDHFVGLALKGLMRLNFKTCLPYFQPRTDKRKHFHINRFTFLMDFHHCWLWKPEWLQHHDPPCWRDLNGLLYLPSNDLVQILPLHGPKADQIIDSLQISLLTLSKFKRIN